MKKPSNKQQLIAVQRRAGYTFLQIAKMMNIHPSTVTYHFNKYLKWEKYALQNDLMSTEQQYVPKKNRVTDKQHYVAEKYRAGYSFSQIANMMNITYSAVRQHYNKYLIKEKKSKNV